MPNTFISSCPHFSFLRSSSTALFTFTRCWINNKRNIVSHWLRRPLHITQTTTDSLVYILNGTFFSPFLPTLLIPSRQYMYSPSQRNWNKSLKVSDNEKRSVDPYLFKYFALSRKLWTVQYTCAIYLKMMTQNKKEKNWKQFIVSDRSISTLNPGPMYCTWGLHFNFNNFELWGWPINHNQPRRDFVDSVCWAVVFVISF
jgi:hypothetical protein